MATSFLVLISTLLLMQVLDFLLTAARLLSDNGSDKDTEAKTSGFFIKKLCSAIASLVIRVLIIAPAVWTLGNHPLNSTTDLLVLIGVNLLYVWMIIPQITRD